MQYEISLREMLLKIWGAKKIVIIITIASLLVSWLVSFYLIKPKFQVYSVISTYSVLSASNDKDIKDISQYVNQGKSKFILDKVVSKLNLDKSVFSADRLARTVTIQSEKGSNVLTIAVKGKDPKIITEISNSIAYELSNLVEISSELNVIVQTKKRLMEVNDVVAVLESEIRQATVELQNTPSTLNTQKSLAEEPYLQSIQVEKTGTTSKKAGSLELNNEEVNPVYTILKSKLATASIEYEKVQTEKKVLEKRIEESEKNIQELQKHPAENGSVSTEFLSQSSNQYNSVLITPAIEPYEAVGPSPKILTILGGFIGLLAALFIVFMRIYFSTSNTQKAVSSNSSIM